MLFALRACASIRALHPGQGSSIACGLGVLVFRSKRSSLLGVVVGQSEHEVQVFRDKETGGDEAMKES
eukprot:113182-Pleurochrysis_carterae.AAC.2